MGCRICDYDPCMCGRRDYPNTTCRYCGYSSGCVCGMHDYEDEKEDDYDPDFDRYREGP